ncbi:MAG: extracellular solute-binding protein [Oscillospiraceae bacterium]
MKKALALVLSLAMAAGMLASCGKKPASTPASTPASAPASVAAPAKDVEITWWAFPVFAQVDGTVGKYEQSIADAFMAKNPNIKVKVEMIDFTSGPEKIATAIQGGTAPDVLFDAPGRIVDYGKSGALAPLDDLFTEDFKKDVNNANIVASCSDGKNYYMYPLSVGPFVMAYNKTILEKEGLMDMVNTEGDRAWTTEQFTKLNEALAKKGYKNAQVFCSGQGGDQGTRAFMTNLFSSNMTDDGLTKYTINDENGVKAMQYVMDEVKKGNLENGTAKNGGESIDDFVAGSVTSTLLWAAGNDLAKADALKTNGVEVLALPLPSDDGKPELEYLVNGFCAFDNKDADKIAASKELIKFLCDDSVVGPQNVKATNVFPARSSFGDLYAGDAAKAFYASQTKYFDIYYNTIDGFASMRPAWFSNLQAALTGDKDAKTAMNDFVTDANKAIAEAQ